MSTGGRIFMSRGGRIFMSRGGRIFMSRGGHQTLRLKAEEREGGQRDMEEAG